jgi:transposase-like protein
MSDLQNPAFNDAEKAREFLEAHRWPNGPFCPRCGAVENIRKLEGKSHRAGLHQCNECRQHFTVTVGTLFEGSHVPLHKWLQAMHLLCTSKKGISSHQIHRTIGVTYKTAWFMTHRIREAMAPGGNVPPLGGEGKAVEADETYVGGKEKNKHAKDRKHQGRGPVGKQAVLSLVERGGKVRSHHVQHVTAATLRPILNEQLDAASRLMTDEARVYSPLGKDFAEHHAVNHGIGEYVRGDAHTNTVEGYFSIFKRGMNGVYQHCGEQHLKRYLAEFDFRYNTRSGLGVEDADRMLLAIKGIEGKRLTYRRANSKAA